ncbi:OmpA family protein [Pseudomonas sp. SIMBA_077]
MTLKLTRGLWLWAGLLVFGVILVIPLPVWLRAMAVLAIASGVTAAWICTGRRSAQPSTSWALAETLSLPPATYRQPVVLVCGDGLEVLFPAIPAEQLALRTTEQGCYVRVTHPEQLPTVIAGITSMRPQWSTQLCVMFVVNPAEHTDDGVLAGQLCAFHHQLTRIRRSSLALPLLVVSYLQASDAEGAWFSWDSGRASPDVHEGLNCVSLADWQRQTINGSMLATRLHTSVQLNHAAAWLRDVVLSRWASDTPRHPIILPVVCAMTWVPALPQALADNLWQQRLRDKIALTDDGHVQQAQEMSLPFPDALLQLLPVHAQEAPIRRASKLALWLFVVACTAAFVSSARQNTLLLRQISDDLRRYAALAPSTTRAQPEFAQREQAVEVLREEARRLDSYYRHGEPLALGLGLYRGERLREPLLKAIGNHRQPAGALPGLKFPDPVRLDSLSLFSPGSAQLKPDSTKVLIGALVGIKAQPDWLIVIAGHTDTTGSAEQNLTLSRARAAAVHDWMQRMGDLPDSCFAVQGFGATQPIASNDTAAGRALNRRVDIRLVPAVGACVPTEAPGKQHPVASRDF